MSDRVTAVARLAITLALAAFVIVAVASAPTPDVDRVDSIGSIIKCPVCGGESIAASPAALARDMMAMVRQGVDDGLTDDQVIESVVGAYGKDVQVLDPSFKASTLALWAIPAVVLVGGVAVTLGRRRTDVPASAPKELAGNDR
jgi:cytochrome c-type biogenesis protein CcmH